MPKGPRLTDAQRQQIIDLYHANRSYNEIAAITGRPYHTVSGVCYKAGLRKEPPKDITIVHDPANLFKLGPTEFTQADLCYMLLHSGLQPGFTVTIGEHRIEVRDGIFVRDDGRRCPPNRSGALKWQ